VENGKITHEEIMSKELIPAHDEMKTIELMAKHAIDSKHLEKIGGFPGAVAIALYARELGVPIMSALYGGIRPVLGKVEISPQMMNALIRKAGHNLQTKCHTNETCCIWGKRKDTAEEMLSTFSIQDAKIAGIYKSGGAWEKYPKNMIYKSAISNLAKWLFPDVIGMSYVEGEIEKPEDEIQQSIIEGITESVDIVSNKSIEIEHVEKIPIADAFMIDDLIGTDEEYRQRILSHYKAEKFSDVPMGALKTILEKIELHNQKKEKDLEEIR
jgi:RecT family